MLKAAGSVRLATDAAVAKHSSQFPDGTLSSCW
jgi:hypothetical protein